jgi:hypothetical protein
MARIIILSIESNAEAEDFARWLLDGNAPKTWDEGDLPVVPRGTKIEAMIARPTVACRGPHRVPGKLRSQMGWTRTQRFGWWVCSVCKKPSPTVVRDFIRNMCNGHNDLLPELQGLPPQVTSRIVERR